MSALTHGRRTRHEIDSKAGPPTLSGVGLMEVMVGTGAVIVSHHPAGRYSGGIDERADSD